MNHLRALLISGLLIAGGHESALAADPPRRVTPSRSVPMPKALAFQQTRIDVGNPSVQNWEVQLALLHSGSQASADRLFAVWMTGEPAADQHTVTRIAAAHSEDGGRTFTRVALQSPVADDAVPFDPVVGHDASTGRTFVSVMEQSPPFLRQVWVARSDPNDPSHFEPGRLLALRNAEPVDKGWFAMGRDPLDATRSLVYLSALAGMRVSRDGGETWAGPTLLPGSSNLLQPIVLDDGTLLVAHRGDNEDAALTRSVDGGLHYQPPLSIHTFAGGTQFNTSALPGTFRVPPTTVLAAAPSGRVYAVLHDVTRHDGSEADVDVLLFESDDQGVTWSAGRNVTADTLPGSDQFMPWLGVDARGGLHLAYYDTQRFTGVDADPDAQVDVMYAFSGDGGQTWSRMRLTPQPLDSFGTRWSPLGNATSAQFLGDYFTLVVSQRAVYVAHPVFDSGVYGMAVSRIEIVDPDRLFDDGFEDG